MYRYLLIWLATINLFGLIAMGWDKRRSKKKGARRLPEKTAFLLAGIGGSLGVLIAMLIFHHKTRHWYFVLFIPLIMILQIALLWLVWPYLQ